MRFLFFTLLFSFIYSTICLANINGVTANAGPDHVICQGGRAILDGSNSTSTANYQWTVISGDFESITDGQDKTNMPSATPKVDSVYELTVTDPIDGCTSTDQVFVDVEIDLNPIAAATVSIFNCESGEITLDGSETLPPPLVPNAQINYLWFRGTNPPAGFVNSTAITNTTITENTTFTLIVVAQENCADTATVNIDLPDCNTTSTKNTLLNYVEIYPNPVQDYLNINLGDIDHNEVEIDLLNMSSQRLTGSKISSTSNTFKLNIESIKNGVYLARIRVGTEIIYKQVSVMR